MKPQTLTILFNTMMYALGLILSTTLMPYELFIYALQLMGIVACLGLTAIVSLFIYTIITLSKIEEI